MIIKLLLCVTTIPTAYARLRRVPELQRHGSAQTVSYLAPNLRRKEAMAWGGWGGQLSTKKGTRYVCTTYFATHRHSDDDRGRLPSVAWVICIRSGG